MGCGDGERVVRDDPTPPQSGGTVVTTARAGACPLAAEVCSFAAALVRDLVVDESKARGPADLAPIVAAARSREYTYPTTRLQGLGGPYPLCDNASAGEKRQGHAVGFLSSEGEIVDAEGLRGALGAGSNRRSRPRLTSTATAPTACTRLPARPG
jgi:hypothetical protein